MQHANLVRRSRTSARKDQACHVFVIGVWVIFFHENIVLCK
jgi:hypothetical protein